MPRPISVANIYLLQHNIYLLLFTTYLFCIESGTCHTRLVNIAFVNLNSLYILASSTLFVYDSKQVLVYTHMHIVYCIFTTNSLDVEIVSSQNNEKWKYCGSLDGKEIFWLLKTLIVAVNIV